MEPIVICRAPTAITLPEIILADSGMLLLSRESFAVGEKALKTPLASVSAKIQVRLIHTPKNRAFLPENPRHFIRRARRPAPRDASRRDHPRRALRFGPFAIPCAANGRRR